MERRDREREGGQERGVEGAGRGEGRAGAYLWMVSLMGGTGWQGMARWRGMALTVFSTDRQRRGGGRGSGRRAGPAVG
eukprot:1573195-Rhodomonas_salina.1